MAIKIPASTVTEVLDAYRKGLPVKELVAETGLSQSSIYRILNGTIALAEATAPRTPRRRLGSADDPEEAWAKVRAWLINTTFTTDGGCWATSLPAADGTVRVGAEHVRLPRLAFKAFIGDPTGKRIGRLCHLDGDSCSAQAQCRRRCWRPDHLYVVGARPAALLARQARGGVTHCPQRHDYDLTTVRFTVTRTGAITRACRVCARDASRQRRRHTASATHTGRNMDTDNTLLLCSTAD